MIAYIAISAVKINYLSVLVAFFVIKVWSLYLRTCSVIYPTTILSIPTEESVMGPGPLMAKTYLEEGHIFSHNDYQG